MSLVGKYVCEALGASLEITEANTANGEGAGTLSIGDVNYPVNLHYHFENNSGQNTVLQIWNSNFYGYDYAGAAGSTKDQSGTSGINLAGGVSSTSTTTDFAGMFVKQ